MCRKAKLIFFAMMILLPMGCSSESSNTPSTKDASEDVGASNDTILARVGSEEITESYVKGKIADLPLRMRVAYDDKDGKQKMLEHIIDTRLFAYGARKMSLDQRPDIEAKIREAREQMLAGEYLRHITESATVNEADIKAYYQERHLNFYVPEKARLRHLAVKSEEEAQEVLALLKSGGDFAEIAEERSIDASKKRGGDLGWVTKGTLQKEINEAAFKLEKGEFSDIVQTKNGYHIIKLEDRKEASTIPLEDVKDNIGRILAPKKKDQALDEARSKLREEIGVQLLSDNENSDQEGPGKKGKGEPPTHKQ